MDMHPFELTIGLVFVFLSYSSAKSISQNETNENDRLSALEKSVEILQSRINNLTRTPGTIPHKPVLFYARLSGVRSLNKKSVVMFDEALTNEGNYFNTGDGIFVAPYSGLYQFSWTIITTSGKVIHTELRVDNVVKAYLHISLGTGTIPATRTVACHVKKGDHVWIQTSQHYTDNYFAVPNHDCKSSFMGFFIG